jgi:hypothetical protein
VLMKQLIEEETSKLVRETAISREILTNIIEKAKTSTYLLKNAD